MNLAAFRWGRRAAHDPAAVQALVGKAGPEGLPKTDGLDEIVARRADFLAAYQNAAYAQRYRDRIAAVCAAEDKASPGSTVVSEAAARSLFKLMAIKDEYEVARLYTDGSFKRQLASEFQSFDRLEFHLAPPILGRKGSDGKPRKSSFGPWMMTGFRMLAALKGLRGTPLDVFGRTAERRMERRLLAGRLSADRIEAAAALASVPQLVRGFGHVKEDNARKAAEERRRLLERLDAPAGTPRLQAAE